MRRKLNLAGANRIPKRLLAAGLGCLVAASTAVADFPREPMVAIETGMHTAAIKRIDVDREERFVVTGSNDKTIRVWDLRNGQLLRTIRVPIASGDAGKIYAVAMSPDGRLIAAGGFLNPAAEPEEVIYLFDRASGALIERIEGLPNVVHHLAFSPDGRLLAATLWGANGVRLYETDGFTEVARDDDYDDNSYWLDFAPDGRIATTSNDGFIRLYDSRLEPVSKTEAPSGRRPFTIAFSPDGHEIAVGYADTTAVDIVSAGELRLLHSLDTSDVTNGDLGSVAWSADGERLCAGGRYGDGTGANPLRCWGERGRGSFEDVTFGATDTIQDLRPLAMGGLRDRNR